MEEKLDKITKLYNSVSKEYADAFSGEHEKKPMDREILSIFSREVGNENPVWDLGCGPGQTTNYLRNLGIHASGLDISGQMLDQARRRYPDIHFQQGNILALEFEDSSIAAIISFYAMVHFTKDQVEKAFREIHRVLRPNGLFLFTYHVGEETICISEFLGKQIDMDFMFFTTDFITGCLTDCGFKQIDTIERDPYPGVEYQSRRAYLFTTKPEGE